MFELLEEVSSISFKAPSAFLSLLNKRTDVFHVALIGPPTFVPKGGRLVIYWPTAFQEAISDLLEFCYSLVSRCVHVHTGVLESRLTSSQPIFWGLVKRDFAENDRSSVMVTGELQAECHHFYSRFNDHARKIRFRFFCAFECHEHSLPEGIPLPLEAAEKGAVLHQPIPRGAVGRNF